MYCSGDMKKHFAHLTNGYRDAFYNTVSVGQETDLILVPIIHQYICLWKQSVLNACRKTEKQRKDNSFAASAF